MTHATRTIVLGTLMLTAGACGDHQAPPTRLAEIASHQAVDGEIAFDATAHSYAVTLAPVNQYLLYGYDDTQAAAPEHRAFLDFPLDASAGGEPLPPGARMQSASLQVFIDQTDFVSTVPTVLDFVPYPVTGPREVDFDSSFISSESFSVFASDSGAILDIEVSQILEDALVRGVRDFQLRLRLDPASPQGLVRIDDGSSMHPPMLVVSYRDR